MMLFLSLCRAHRLRWAEWWLLWRVARDQKVKDPARLFLEPRWLDSARLRPVLRLRAARLESIRRRLFGRLLGGDVSQPGPAGRDPDGRRPSGEPNAASSSVPPVPGGTTFDAGIWPSDGPPLQDPSSTASS
jgi:hypothetical protein